MLAQWKTWLWNMTRDILAVFMAMRDPNVPFSAKALGVAALVYLISPVDIIPDIIPVFGWLDDLAMLPLLGTLASRLIDRNVFERWRAKADGILTRLGPKIVLYTVLFILLWLTLAAIGGWLMLRRWW